MISLRSVVLLKAGKVLILNRRLSSSGFYHLITRVLMDANKQINSCPLCLKDSDANVQQDFPEGFDLSPLS